MEAEEDDEGVLLVGEVEFVKGGLWD